MRKYSKHTPHVHTTPLLQAIHPWVDPGRKSSVHQEHTKLYSQLHVALTWSSSTGATTADFLTILYHLSFQLQTKWYSYDLHCTGRWCKRVRYKLNAHCWFHYGWSMIYLHSLYDTHRSDMVPQTSKDRQDDWPGKTRWNVFKIF